MIVMVKSMICCHLRGGTPVMVHNCQGQELELEVDGFVNFGLAIGGLMTIETKCKERPQACEIIAAP